MNKPTPAEQATCLNRFVELSGKYGYEKAIGIMAREYNTPDKADIWRAVQCENKAKLHAPSPNASSEHKPDPAHVKAASQWRDLHKNTSEAT